MALPEELTKARKAWMVAALCQMAADLASDLDADVVAESLGGEATVWELMAADFEREDQQDDAISNYIDEAKD